MSNVIHLQVRANQILFYKTDFDADEFECANLNRTERRVTFSENLLTIRQEGIPISSKKYKHLQTWMPWILLQFHDFYKKLSHSETVINDM